MNNVIQFPRRPASGEYEFDPVADAIIDEVRAIIAKHGISRAPFIATIALMEFDRGTYIPANNEPFTTALNALEQLATSEIPK